MAASASNDSTAVTNALEDLCTAIEGLRNTLMHMHELDPEVFYNKIRPYLAGWEGDESAGLIYEGVCDTPIKLSGGSAAQSSLLQCIDAGLGLVHSTERMEFLLEMRDYMPPAHNSFIEALEKRPSLREYVSHHMCDDLTVQYNSCIQALAQFRSTHIQIVTKYIVIPSHKSTNQFDGISNKGTGGMTLMPFLKDIRNSTMTSSLAKSA